jgi:hypothetical protein
MGAAVYSKLKPRPTIARATANITNPFAKVCKNTPSMMITEPMMMVYFLPIFSTSHQRKNCEKTPPRP